MDRKDALLSLRPELAISIKDDKNPIESFMHTTLRPILKFQNELILASIRNEPHFDQLKLENITEEQCRSLIKVFFQKKSGLRAKLVGLIQGLFTEEELKFYFEQRKELDRRITEMLVTRFVSQL